MNNIRYEVSQGVSMSPKTVSRCPESISVKVPWKCFKVPLLFQVHIVTATSSISQLQALATGIVFKSLFFRYLIWCLKLPQVASQGVSIFVVKNLLFQKLNICLGGWIYLSQGAPVSPTHRPLSKFCLGHTNLFNCFNESPPKISENGKKKIEISKILFLFFSPSWIYSFQSLKKMKTVSFLLCQCNKQLLVSLWAKLTRCGQSDTTQCAVRCRHQVWKIADKSSLTLRTLWFCSCHVVSHTLHSNSTWHTWVDR